MTTFLNLLATFYVGLFCYEVMQKNNGIWDDIWDRILVRASVFLASALIIWRIWCVK